MSLLNHQIHYNPAGHKDILAKLRDFAMSRGWTSVHYEQNKRWASIGGGQYGWVAGNEDFLQLFSDGYGGQSMTFRFRATGDGSDPQHELLYASGINPAQAALNQASSGHPVDQNLYSNTQNYKISLSPGMTPALYLFGNAKFIAAVVQLSPEFIQALYFGTYELFDPSEDEAYTVLVSCWTGGVMKWYQAVSNPGYFYLPWYYDNANVWYGGAALNNRSRYNVYFTESGYGAFNALYRAVRANNFTGKRVLIKPTVFFQRPSDNLWFPVGTFPFYWIEYAGLFIGQKLTFGTEEYLCFPNSFNTRRYGIAMRVG